MINGIQDRTSPEVQMIWTTGLVAPGFYHGLNTLVLLQGCTLSPGRKAEQQCQSLPISWYASFSFSPEQCTFCLECHRHCLYELQVFVGCSSYLLLHHMNGDKRSSKLLDGITIVLNGQRGDWVRFKTDRFISRCKVPRQGMLVCRFLPQLGTGFCWDDQWNPGPHQP